MAAELRRGGAEVLVHDPLFADEELVDLGFDPYHHGEAADVVIVQADHAEYANWGTESCPGVRLIFDGRGVLDQSNWPENVEFMRIGMPTKTN